MQSLAAIYQQDTLGKKRTSLHFVVQSKSTTRDLKLKKKEKKQQILQFELIELSSCVSFAAIYKNSCCWVFFHERITRFTQQRRQRLEGRRRTFQLFIFFPFFSLTTPLCCFKVSGVYFFYCVCLSKNEKRSQGRPPLAITATTGVIAPMLPG